MLENQLDPIDALILKELTADARIPLIQLSRKLKVSNTLIHQRIRKLKELGILKTGNIPAGFLETRSGIFCLHPDHAHQCQTPQASRE